MCSAFSLSLRFILSIKARLLSISIYSIICVGVSASCISYKVSVCLSRYCIEFQFINYLLLYIMSVKYFHFLNSFLMKSLNLCFLYSIYKALCTLCGSNQRFIPIYKYFCGCDFKTQK